MAKLKVMSVFGTRPEAIKMAPLVLELRRRRELESVVCVTAQHREMLDSVLDEFGIRPEHDLNIMKSSQTLADITSRVLQGLGPVLEQEKPGLVLVHGDTTTTFAAAFAAFYARIPVGHVEAGLRTYDRWSPWPEEMNRRMTGQLASFHFAPTQRNAENLRRENVEGGIWVTGNTVIDALRYTASGEGFSRPELSEIDYVNHRVVTLTCHRRENYGKPMRNIFEAVRNTALRFPDVIFVYPVHLSPVVREAAGELLSGVLRRETERPEAVDAGTVALAGTGRENIEKLAAELLTDKAAYDKMARAVNPYGDGHACPRIADAICYAFGLSERRPEEFKPQ